MNERNVHIPVIGNERVLQQLIASLQQRRSGHAFIFHGPTHVGKRHAALELFKYIAHSSSLDQIPDFIELHCLEGEDVIRVDQIRSLSSRLAVKPIYCGQHLVLVSDAETMNESAANALLKRIEEPRSSALFILTTSRRASVPATIRSRCTPIPFTLVPTERIKQWLRESHSVAAQQAYAISQMSEGRPGVAQKLLEPGVFEEYTNQIKEWVAILKVPATERVLAVQRVIKTDTPIGEIRDRIHHITLLMRDMLLIRHGVSPITFHFMEAPLKKLAEQWDENRIVTAIRTVERYQPYLGRSINSQLILENIAISL